ncbi:hypothetical protein RHOSPDRAFT_34373 [Rhodotorula sp. JG-1b]|nr:hypothetical protein RHOSPDRAFT_34373 [Rhodotorula sp. JG-1b]
MASASPPPPPDPNRLRTSPCCGSSSSSPPRNALRRSKTVANPESPLRWRREPLVDVTNLVLGRAGREMTGRLQRLPSVEPSPFDDASEAPETPTRTANRPLPLRRTRSALPQMAGEASSSPSRPAPSLRAMPADGLDSPVASASMTATTRELRPRTRPAVASHETTRRAARSRVGSGGGGGSGTGPPLPPPRIGTPLARRRTFGGLDSLSPVHENYDASELSPPRPTTPLTRSRSEAGIDGGGGISSEAPSSSGPSDSTRRLRRRRTTEPTSSSSSSSSSSTAPTSTVRSSARKGLR